MEDRKKEHQKNTKLEELLNKVNTLLSISEKETISDYVCPNYPIILIVGCARSGSTLLFQWLSKLGIFAYPSNFLSRFYEAPIIGAMIQKLLTDPIYAFRDELIEFQVLQNDYQSFLGKTKGFLEQHNFIYFCRRFFNPGENQKLDEEELKTVNYKTLLAELAGIEAVFDMPLVMKAMNLNWNIAYLNKIYSKFLFLHIKRELLQNTQSLLIARNEFFGKIENWYSYKPPEYSFLKDLNPYEQVTGQVYYTNKAISDQLNKMKTDQWLTIEYSNFCSNPEFYYRNILLKLRAMGLAINRSYTGPEMFTESKAINLTTKEIKEVMDTYYDLMSENS